MVFGYGLEKLNDLPAHIKHAEQLIYRLEKHRIRYYRKYKTPIIEEIYKNGKIADAIGVKGDIIHRYIVRKSTYSDELAVGATGLTPNEVMHNTLDGRCISSKYQSRLTINDIVVHPRVLKKYLKNYELGQKYHEH